MLNIICILLLLCPVQPDETIWTESFDYLDGNLPEHIWSEGCQGVIKEGRLFIEADTTDYRCATVWFDREFFGDLSVEFDVNIISSGDTANNINFFFMYSDPSGQPLRKSAHKRKSGLYKLYHELNGYVFTHVTNGDETKVRYRLRDNPGFMLVNETFTEEKREHGKTYHIKIEKRGNRFIYQVDGKKISDTVDDRFNPIHEKGWMGLRTWHTSLWIDNLCVKKIVSAAPETDEYTVQLGPVVQVGPAGSSSIFSFYNTSPESPDGKSLFYLRYKEEPPAARIHVPGELWICDRDLKNHRRIADINGMTSHNGSEAQWIDNQHIAMYDKGIIRVVDIRNGEDILKKRIETTGISHDSFQGRIMFAIHERGETAYDPGIYELNCFTEEISLIKRTAKMKNTSLPSYIDSVYPIEDWRILHLQYAPDGKKISFRLDVGDGESRHLLGICNKDGSNFHIHTRPLHFLWYDNESIVGHIQFNKQGKRPEIRAERFNLRRWNVDGTFIETLSPRGNHLAISPDRSYFANETFYNSNPVIIYLIGREQKERVAEIDSFPPYDLVWDKRFHVNPAFSRDSKRIYYSKPLNETYSGTFYREIIHQ